MAEELTDEQKLENERTHQHKGLVTCLLMVVVDELQQRMRTHDQSKLELPEVAHFAKVNAGGAMSKLTYGSKEYKATLQGELAKALEHHYAHNAHHPEHYPNGINGMTLVDLLEMLVDWKAATLRHADGDIWRSLKINQERFDIGPQLQQILHNTVAWLETRSDFLEAVAADNKEETGG